MKRYSVLYTGMITGGCTEFTYQSNNYRPWDSVNTCAKYRISSKINGSWDIWNNFGSKQRPNFAPPLQGYKNGTSFFLLGSKRTNMPNFIIIGQ